MTHVQLGPDALCVTYVVRVKGAFTEPGKSIDPPLPSHRQVKHSIRYLAVTPQILFEKETGANLGPSVGRWGFTIYNWSNIQQFYVK